jgi:opacity protein-like surface antigen
VSDPITLWIRGDASGFGLAGDTDLSWNLLFGVDWWVNRQISLQFAYRFYGIEYKNGSGDNAFGFTENFNGPVSRRHFSLLT